MSSKLIVQARPAATSLLDHFVELRTTEQLDTLKEGENLLFDSLGIVTYFGKMGEQLEFGGFIEGSEYIFALRGNRQDAMLRNGCFLDFASLSPDVYIPRDGQAYTSRKDLIETGGSH